MKTTNTDQALAEFLAARADCLAMLASLTQHATDHFGVNPDSLGWAQVGDAKKTRSDLIELVRSLGIPLENEN